MLKMKATIQLLKSIGRMVLYQREEVLENLVIVTCRLSIVKRHYKSELM